MNTVLTRGAGRRVVLKVQRGFLLGSSQPTSPHTLLHLYGHSDSPAEMHMLRNTHTHNMHRSHTAPQTGKHTAGVHTHTHTQETCTKVTPQPPQTHIQRHTCMETHAHGDTLQCAEQPTHQIPILRNTHKEIQSSVQCYKPGTRGQRHRYIHGDAQKVPPAVHTGLHPQKHTATQRRAQRLQTGARAHAETSECAMLCIHGHRQTQRYTEKQGGWKHIPQVHAHGVAHACGRSHTPTQTCADGSHSCGSRCPDRPAQPLDTGCGTQSPPDTRVQLCNHAPTCHRHTSS